MFIVIPISLLLFSGWWFYKAAADTGRGMAGKIAYALGGAILFLLLTEALPRMFADMWMNMLRQGDDAPVIAGLMLICAGIIFIAGLLLRQLPGGTPPGDSSSEDQAPD